MPIDYSCHQILFANRSFLPIDHSCQQIILANRSFLPINHSCQQTILANRSFLPIDHSFQQIILANRSFLPIDHSCQQTLLELGEHILEGQVSTVFRLDLVRSVSVYLGQIRSILIHWPKSQSRKILGRKITESSMGKCTVDLEMAPSVIGLLWKWICRLYRS